MAWVKLDDNFFLHPKARAVGSQGQLLYLAGLCWAARSETGGVVPTGDLPLLAATVGVKATTVRLLVDADLWEVHPDGWEIHDYLEYNPTAEEARERRRKRAEAGRKGGLKSRPPGSKPEANASPSASAEPEADGELEANSNGTPSPFPLVTDSHPQTTSSCGKPDIDEERPKRPSRDRRLAIAEAACVLLADQAHTAAVARGVVKTPVAHRKACVASALTDYLGEAQLIAHENPTLNATEVAAKIVASDAGFDVAKSYRIAEERNDAAAQLGPETADRATNLNGIAAAKAARAALTETA